MPKRQLICGLDVGTNTVRALAALKNPGESELQVISQGEAENSGMRKGVVIGVDEVSRNISQAFGACEQDLERKTDSVLLSINGSHLGFVPSRGLVQVSRADQKISESDIDRAFQASRVLSLPANQEILDVFPQEFVIDGQAGIKEALGLRGIKLEAKTLCLTVFSPYLKNLSEAVLKSDLNIEHVIPSVLATSAAVLDKKEKESGVALLEIGGGTTGLAVFEEGDLVHAAVFPIGSNNITNDIAIVLKTEIETAEAIKREFAGLCSRKNIGKSDKKYGFSQKTLTRVIEARTREIFHQANQELKRINKEKLASGVVLAGGGAKLFKIVDFAKKELRLFCRLGEIKGFSPEIQDLNWATAAGLVLEGARIFEEEGSDKWLFKGAKNIFKVFIP